MKARVLSLFAAAALLVSACASTADRMEAQSPSPDCPSQPGVGASRQQRSRPALSKPRVVPRTTIDPAAYRHPLVVARAWAMAAHSSSYADATPGKWTRRTRWLVTGDEAVAERVVGVDEGGSTWGEIVARRCAMKLRELTAMELPDVPPGPRARIVDVAGTQVLTCGDGTAQLSPVTVELVLRLVSGRWLVAQVTH